MAVKLIYDWYSTSEFTDTSKAQAITPEKNIIMRNAHAYLCCVNDPAFTNISMKIYADRSNSPGKLLYTSTDVRTKADILTDNSCFGWFYFTFNDVELRKDNKYWVVLNATGYTGTATSNVGWAKAWPDTVYDDAVPVNSISGGKNQFGVLIHSFGDEL